MHYSLLRWEHATETIEAESADAALAEGMRRAEEDGGPADWDGGDVEGDIQIDVTDHRPPARAILRHG